MQTRVRDTFSSLTFTYQKCIIYIGISGVTRSVAYLESVR